MCGIAGNTINERVDDAIRKISYRGPDDRGTFVDKNISLGHCRLSIIDLSQNAHQPMTREGLTIVYNGEIYNFRELGYKSSSDTEVILKGYKDEGISFFSKLRGMWAFALYDKQKLILARDIFGYKGQVVHQASADNDYLIDNPNHRCPVISKARSELGYNPGISLDEGLSRSLIWYYDNREAEEA